MQYIAMKSTSLLMMVTVKSATMASLMTDVGSSARAQSQSQVK